MDKPNFDESKFWYIKLISKVQYLNTSYGLRYEHAL